MTCFLAWWCAADSDGRPVEPEWWEAEAPPESVTTMMYIASSSCIVRLLCVEMANGMLICRSFRKMTCETNYGDMRCLTSILWSCRSPTRCGLTIETLRGADDHTMSLGMAGSCSPSKSM